MRPTCSAILVLGALVLSCAPFQDATRAFVDKAAACHHMQGASPTERLAAPCRYADALAMCLGTPERLRADIVAECVEQRDRLRDEVLPAYTEAAEG